MGTAGQRCTTLRRLIVHESVYDALIPKLIKVYGSVKIGDPREAGVLVGPLVDEAAYKGMQTALSPRPRPQAARSMAASRSQSAPAASMSAPRWSRCPRRPARSSARPSRRSSM
jgi:acyl-CoA reductase-like NAD-dependent aldehyde dehydrogenase